jgi:hypothetical protein
MRLEAGYRLGLPDLFNTSRHAGDQRGRGVHLSHGVHSSADADLRLDGLEVLVKEHAHAGLHGHGKPEQEVVVLAEQGVLEVDGCMRNDQQAGESCEG